MTRGDEKLLQVGRQLATADRAREREQRRLQASYRQLAVAASTAGLRETAASRSATTAAKTKTGSITQLSAAQQRLQREVLGAARAQLTEERAMRSATRAAAQYSAAKQRQVESLAKVTAAANTSSAALSRNARAGAAAARTGGGGALTEARQAGSRGIGIATGVAGAAGAAGIFGLAGLAREAIDYERQMSQVQAVMGATRQEMRQLDAMAVDLGAKTAFSASESSMALSELGKAGFTAQQSLKTLPGTIDLAAASGTELADAATIQSDALRGFGMDVSQSTHVADVFAVAVNRSAIEMSDLGYTLKYMAPIAATTGQSFEDMSAAVAILGNVGIRGDTAGTTLRRVMTSLVKPTAASTEALAELGLKAKDLQGPDGLLPLPDIIARLVEEASKLPKADQMRVMTTIFGRESISGTMALLDHGAPKLRALAKEMRNADGAADDMARTMQDNVYYQMEQVQGAVESLALTIFKEFAPGLQAAATSAAGSIEVWTATEGNVERITDAIGDFTGMLGDLVAAGMPVVDLAVSMVDAWQGLPDPVRSSVLQFGALALITRKLAGSAAAGGLISVFDRIRGGLRGTAAEATAAQAALGGLTTPIPASTVSATAAGARTAMADGGPSPVTFAARDAADANRAAATRQGALATRMRIEARDAAASYERDMRRMAAMPMVVARAEQQASLARNTSALGGSSAARIQAAEATAAAARKELQTLGTRTEESRRYALERRAAATAATTEARATAQTARLLRSQAGHHARMDTVAAPSAGRIARGREGRQLGAIGTWQMTRGLGGTRRDALAESARRTAGRVPIPSGRGIAGVAAAGGIGAALSGGDVASAAISGGAVGMMAGPWGAAAGAAGAAGITALVNEFKKASTKRAEDAAREFGERITENTRDAMDAGFRRPSARRVGEARATVDAAEQIRKLERQAREARARTPGVGAAGVRGQTSGDIEAQRLIKQARERAKTAGLDYDAVIRRDSNAERGAIATQQREVRGAFASDARRYKWFDERQLQADAKKQLEALSPAARDAAARSMAEWARTIEKDGRLPKGATGRLVMELGRLPGDLPQKWERSTRAAVDAIDSQVEDRRVVRSAKRLMDELGRLSPSLDIELDTKTLPGSVAKMRTQMDTLRKMATDKSLPKEMREDAERQLPGVKKAYDESLTRMAWRMGMSEKDAGTWARRVSRAARETGDSADSVDVLRREVKKLTDEMGTSRDPVKRLEAAFRDLGSTAAQAKKLAEEATKVPPPASGPLIDDRNTFDLPSLPKPKPKPKRTGGPIRAYAHGGPIVDTLMSGGEEYLPPDVASRYPPGILETIANAQRPHFYRHGGPVGGRYNLGGHIIPGPSDRDGTYVPAEEGGFVLTGHGRELRDAMMNFAKGGFVATAYGPPWGGIQGQGVTKTGVDLKSGPKRYIIAVDPSVIPLHTRTGVWPNPFGYRGKFAAEDTGGAIKGKRIDFYDWRGRESQNKWGRRTVSVGTSTTRADGSKAATPGYSYTKVTDDVRGMAARDAYRQRAVLRTPNVDVSGVFDQARQNAYDAVARSQMLSEIVEAGRVNIERRKVTVAGERGRKADSAGGSGGPLPSRSKVVEAARDLRSPNLRGANAGMGVYGRLGKYFGLTISSGRRWGAVTSSGNKSAHGDGSAIDQSGSAANMLRYARWLSSSGIARGMDQLIHTPLGHGWNKGSKVPLSFFGQKVNDDHYDHTHAADTTPPRFRRGGPVGIRRMATGGRVGSTSRIVRDTGRAINTKPAAAALRSLYGAGVREQRQVTDALEQLQTLLGEASKVSVERLAALNRELVRGIDRTRAKRSPGGTAITRGEEAQNRRSRSVLAEVQSEILKRAASPARRADQLSVAIEDQRAMIDRSMRRADVDPESTIGLQRMGRQTDWEKAQRGVQLARLERAREIARKAGRSGRETVQGLDEEIKALRGDISELAVQQVENARAQVASAIADMERAVQGSVDAAQYRVDYSGAQMAEFDAYQSLGRNSGTAEGMMQRGHYQQAQYGPLVELRDTLLHQASVAAQLHGQDSEQFRSAMQSAQQVAAQAVQTLADGAEQIRQASMKAVQNVVDYAAHGSSMSSMGLQGLELRQRLDKTYDGGGHQRAEYIRNNVIPALEAERAALEQRRAESERQEAGQTDKPLTRADMEAIAAKQNEILQASLTAQEAIEANTNSKRTGGSLGFGFGGDVYTDVLLDGVGA